MKSMDLNLLHALDALLETASVTAAAQRLHLSPPAMSHTLARIREALGDPILVRAGRRLTPTPRAIELREPVRRLLAQAHELMHSGGPQALALVQREFVVRAPDGIATVHGAGLLASLREHMPLATLRFVPESDSDAMALRDGRIDLDIGIVHDRGPEIRTGLLYEQHAVGVARQGHPLLGARVTARRLAAHPHVGIGQRARQPEALDRALAELGCARTIALTVPSAYGALMAVARSSMVCCAPELLARTVGPSLGLKVFKLPVVLPPEQVVQAWHPRFEADAAHQCLRAGVAELSTRIVRGPPDELSSTAPQRHKALLALVKP
jgi:DNA-binding transcriptional LysR family regulator